jgi:hypothetical protein
MPTSARLGMILINNDVMDLVLGYNIIREAERELRSKWRTRLLSAYVRKRQAYEADGTVSEPLEHPLQGDLKAKLLGSLLSDWHQCLGGQWAAEDRAGDRGENAFVNSLQQIELPTCFIVHGLRQRQSDDVDVTVVGPIGIWVFEVKFWRDKIGYHNGIWHYDPPHLERKQDPDKQWERMAKDVKNTVLGHDLFLISRVPEFETIHGGIVFAHSGAHLDIVDCPVKWGTIADWQKCLRDVEIRRQIDEADVLAVLDALLAQHHGVELRGIRSMQGCAQQLVQETEAKLEAWTRVHSEDDFIVWPADDA